MPQTFRASALVPSGFVVDLHIPLDFCWHPSVGVGVGNLLIGCQPPRPILLAGPWVVRKHQLQEFIMTSNQTTPEATRQTKQALLIGLLQRPQGASIAELVAATGWQNHSIRGAISFALKKKLGLNVTSQRDETRGRVYRIAKVTKPSKASTSRAKKRS